MKRFEQRISGKRSGSKWDTVVLRIALAVHARSGSAYKHLRQLLNLPGEKTLSDIFKANKQTPGSCFAVYQFAIDAAIGQGIDLSKPRNGTLMHDEVIFVLLLCNCVLNS